MRTFDTVRKKGGSTPNFTEELVFDGSDAELHMDAVRRLFNKQSDEMSEVVPTGQNYTQNNGNEVNNDITTDSGDVTNDEIPESDSLKVEFDLTS